MNLEEEEEEEEPSIPPHQPDDSVGETKTTEEENMNGDTAQEDDNTEAPEKTHAESIGSVPETVKPNGDGVAAEDPAASPSPSIGSPPSQSPDDASSNSIVKKGYGLKKWRRIRRDLSKEAVAPVDSGAILKRRLSAQEPPKSREESKQKSDAGTEGECSVASNSAVPSTPAVVAGPLDPEIGLLAASGGFSVGADSDNSEERSSKSSTAASAPRLRHETVGFGRERSRGKGSGGRGSGHVAQQRSQRGRGGGGGLDASKKFRGDHLKLEKENSHSSIESDLRSSNVAFIRWGSLASSNEKQSERSVNDDGEHSDEAHTGEEVRSGYYKENGSIGDSLREDLDEDPPDEENAGKGDNYRLSTDLDPFVESIVLLQVAQEALETEIQKFEQLGKEPTFDDSNGHLEETGGSGSPAIEAHFLELKQKINHLQHNLDEASVTVKTKESKVLELEAILDRIHFQEKSSDTTDLPLCKENCKEMELELECLLKTRIEAEIEHLIIARATETWKVLPKDQVAFFKEQNTLIEGQAQVMLKLRDADKKAVMLKEQAEELEARCKELLGIEEVLRLQNKVCRSSMCCFIQFVMLFLAFWWFIMQLLPLPDGVVPT